MSGVVTWQHVSLSAARYNAVYCLFQHFDSGGHRRAHVDKRADKHMLIHCSASFFSKNACYLPSAAWTTSACVLYRNPSIYICSLLGRRAQYTSFHKALIGETVLPQAVSRQWWESNQITSIWARFRPLSSCNAFKTTTDNILLYY